MDFSPALDFESTTLSPRWLCLADVTALIPLILDLRDFYSFFLLLTPSPQAVSGGDPGLGATLGQYRIVLMDVQHCGDEGKGTLLWRL